jgi:protein-S-isoprenylcysteine O-methyltransferase Ste14
MLAAFGLPPWLGHLAEGAARVVGIVLVVASFAFGAWARRALGRSFTPLPRPVESGSLATHGPYRFARHPIYTSIIVASAGWSLLWQSAIGAACGVLLLVLFDLKSRREERWLEEAYAGYPEYRRRVKRFIPFVY